MSPVQAPADKRFRRAHVKPGRRRRWQWRPLLRMGLPIGLACAALLWTGAWVTRSRAFTIQRIAVRGNVRLASASVEASLAGLRGRSLMWSELRTWRERVLASPWIKDATLRRVLPSTIEVVVRERVPIGLARIGRDLYLVDEQGLVIDRSGRASEALDLPIIDGLSRLGADEDAAVPGDEVSGAEAAASVDPARADLAARLLGAVKASPEIGDRVSQVDVSDARNAAVILSGDPSLLLLGNDRFVPRLQSYLQLADTMKERVAGIDVVDLRFDDRNRIYVRQAERHEREP